MAPLIKLSKLSHWPAVEINSKQGAPASQVMNIFQTACRGGWGGWGGCVGDSASLMPMTLKVAQNRNILSFFICMQIRLLHKLTPEPPVSVLIWGGSRPPPPRWGPAATAASAPALLPLWGQRQLLKPRIRREGYKSRLRPLLFTALIRRRDDPTRGESEMV